MSNRFVMIRISLPLESTVSMRRYAFSVRDCVVPQTTIESDLIGLSSSTQCSNDCIFLQTRSKKDPFIRKTIKFLIINVPTVEHIHGFLIIDKNFKLVAIMLLGIRDGDFIRINVLLIHKDQ